MTDAENQVHNLTTGKRHTLNVQSGTLEIQGPRQEVLYITHPAEAGQVPQMPLLTEVSVRVVGAAPDLTARTDFVWTAVLNYQTRARPEKQYRTQVQFTGMFRGGGLPAEFFRRAPGRIVQSGGGSQRTETIAAGGDLELRVRAQIDGRSLEGRWAGACRVLASGNPNSASVQRFLAARMGNAQDAATLSRIVCVETHNLQFRSRNNPALYSYAGEPVMNNRGDGGAGIMQVTNPRPGPAELWDWRMNVERAIGIYREKPVVVQGWVTAVRGKVSEQFASSGDNLVTRVNRSRRDLRLPALDRIEVPNLSPAQALDDQIRGFNGFPNPAHAHGQFGLRWHEFWLKVEGSPPRLVVENERMVGRERVADAVWERIPADRRPRQPNGEPYGKPNYVLEVHRASCS